MKPLVCALSVLLATPALADDLIVTDSPVIQSLVAQVSGTVPFALMPAGADPHHFSLKPSQLRQLSKADWLIWVGPNFSPWLDENTLQSLKDVTVLQLADHDAHGWLDPQIAADWSGRIATALGQTFDAARFEQITSELAPELEPLADVPLIVGHDAYGAFASRFGLNIAGTISDSHATTPGARHLSQLRKLIENGAAACIVSDSHEIEPYVELVAGAGEIPVVELDLTGVGIEPGADFYGELMRSIAEQLTGCLNS